MTRLLSQDIVASLVGAWRVSLQPAESVNSAGREDQYEKGVGHAGAAMVHWHNSHAALPVLPYRLVITAY